MGSSQSISLTPLGRSLIGKKFTIKENVRFFYRGYDKVYGLSEWKSTSEIGNPAVNTFNLKIESVMKLEITDIIKRWDIDNKNKITVWFKFLNDIPINDIEKIREHNSYISPYWIDRYNIQEIHSDMVPPITQDELNIIGKEGILYYCDFGLSFPILSTGELDINSPYLLQGNKMIEI